MKKDICLNNNNKNSNNITQAIIKPIVIRVILDTQNMPGTVLST